MAPRIVQNQNRAFLQSREKVMFQERLQIDPLDGAFFLKGGNHAQKIERAEDGEILSSLEGNLLAKPLS